MSRLDPKAYGVLALAAVVVACAGWVLVRDPTPTPAPTATAPTTATTTRTAEPQRVSVLGDSHAYNADSWFRLSVWAGRVPGAVRGVIACQPGAGASAIAKLIPKATEGGGWVIVQAGTNDLLSAKTPAQTARGVEALVDGVTQAGARPILALIPPSNERPTQVVDTNERLTKWADGHGVPVLDVYTAAATKDGHWRDGMTTDQRHANEAGSKVLAQAAIEKLPGILTRSRAG